MMTKITRNILFPVHFQNMALLSVICFCLLCSTVAAQEASKAVTWIEQLEHAQGGYTDRPKGTVSVMSTTAGVRALGYFGSKPKKPADCEKFIISCFDPQTGGFAASPKGKPAVVPTAVALMGLKALNSKFDITKSRTYLVQNAHTFEERRLAIAGMEAFPPIPAEVSPWLTTVKASANRFGVFGPEMGTTWDTGSVAAMVLRTGSQFPKSQQDIIANFLITGQTDDGGYWNPTTKTTDLASTYRVVRAIHLLKAKPKDENKMKSWLAKCQNADGGFGNAPKQPSTISATYQAGIILHWLATKN
ncbi:MAG: prenyltransferase/squalene oxidase repeat-containing protein [Zavarzinella sp.]